MNVNTKCIAARVDNLAEANDFVGVCADRCGLPAKMTAQQLISHLDLVRHPEGGWFRETYRSTEQIDAAALPKRYGGSRFFSTAIYFLLEPGDFSALHRISSDEIWHWHAGFALCIETIDHEGVHRSLMLGQDTEAGEQFQIVIPAGCWFGAAPQGIGYTLVSCTVAPGFDFADFELADKERLFSHFPQHAGLISRLTR